MRVKIYEHFNFSRASLFNLERLDMWCAWIGHLSEKLWPFEFLESFRSSISSVSICNAPESDIRVKSYDHLNCSRASIFQFLASRYVMRLNRIFELKVMTIWISWELLLFNYERLDILCSWTRPPCEKLWPFEFLESFSSSISSVSTYYMPESDNRVKSYDNLNFSRASVVQFQASWYIMRLNLTCVWKVMTIWVSRELRFSISSVSICDAPESDIWLKSYDHLNFSRASVVQFRASWYIMLLN